VRGSRQCSYCNKSLLTVFLYSRCMKDEDPCFSPRQIRPSRALMIVIPTSPKGVCLRLRASHMPMVVVSSGKPPRCVRQYNTSEQFALDMPVRRLASTMFVAESKSVWRFWFDRVSPEAVQCAIAARYMLAFSSCGRTRRPTLPSHCLSC
jgi:hypothetical protein